MVEQVGAQESNEERICCKAYVVKVAREWATMCALPACNCIYARVHRREQVADGEAVVVSTLVATFRKFLARLCLAQDPS